MGQRRLGNVQSDDYNKRPHNTNNSHSSVLNNTKIRKGEVIRAQRRTNENVNMLASQHIINIPVNKSIYNGYNGKQFSLAEQKKRPVSNENVLKVIPIGGLGEMGIGKNMMALEYNDEIIVIDMGFIFPGNDYPGVNYIVPDINWLEANRSKIKAHIFTHAHLDHIGAFRQLIHQIPAPIYATRFTTGMLQKMMEEATSGYKPDYHIMNPEAHETVKLGKYFSVELVRVNHSIPDSAAVIVRTPVGVIVDSGDWRVEDKPVDGKKFDIERLKEVSAKEGILLLMNESTNCESDSPVRLNEYDVEKSMAQIMDIYTNSRLIISCFSSQICRMQLILEEAKRHNRKVAFAGYSIIQNLEVALRAGVIRVPRDTIVKMEDVIKLPDSQVCIVCTGSQGELNAVLNRMAVGSHKYIKVKNSDVIVFSSNPIPGNEKYVVRTVDNLTREGSNIIQNGKALLNGIGPLHFSGHAYYSDHVRYIKALNPKFYMPIHGEFHMLQYNAELAEKKAGVPKDNIFLCDSGDILELTNKSAMKNGRIPVGGIMYDDNDAIVSEVVLKDRIHMSTEGIFVVVLTLQKNTHRILTSPDIISRGFIYLRDNEELMGSVRQYLKQKAGYYFGQQHKNDIDQLKKEIRDDVTYILYDKTKRMPIVIPVVNEVMGEPRNNGYKNNHSQVEATDQNKPKAAEFQRLLGKRTLPKLPEVDSDQPKREDSSY